MAADEFWAGQRKLLGQFIRTQRNLANMSLRELSERTAVSNPYLSQIERGLHEPSVRVLKAIATALNLSAETLLSEAGLIDEDDTDGSGGGSADTAAAILADPSLTPEQKQALLAVYRSYRDSNA
jgi:transcriptional regulator with XRE-family HTH domain